jgi:hypothetical protein
MKVLKIIWAVLFTLVTIAVAFAVLSAGDTKFQNVVLAVLVQLYVVLRGIGFGLAQLLGISERASFARFIELGRLLNHGSCDEYADELKTATATAEASINRQYIEITGLGIISIAATLKLLTAIF